MPPATTGSATRRGLTSANSTSPTARADDLEWTPDANYLGEIYHNGEVLTGRAWGDALEDIDGQLTQGGAITGTVTDASGNPLLNAWVYAYGGDAD